MSEGRSPAEIMVQNLRYSYPPLTHDGDPVPVLRGVDFQVPRGQFVALLGRTGAGKTTLCMALNGLVPHATGGIYRGDVTVAGLNTKQHAVEHLARFTGLVFQDPESQLVQMRVEDEVAFGLENLGLPAPEIDARVAWALAAVGLSAYRDRSPLALSGGEKQRLAIAAVLAMQPRVLVLDEPTASLDPAGKAGIFRLLAGLRARQDITIVMATQELDRIGHYADRVLVLHEGHIALDDRPAAVFGQVARLHQMGIGVPEMAELAHDLTQATGLRLSFMTEAAAYRKLRHCGRPAARHGPCPVEVTTPPPSSPDSTPGDPQIIVEGISYDYDGMPALHDVQLVIRSGEFIALLGPNGAGKTTLARHFNGLLRPGKGRVLVENQDTGRVKVARLASLVGYVFQNPDHQIFAATVRDEVAFGLRNQGLAPAIIDQRVHLALERFDLGDKAGMQPALLGFGERRKVALAAILAMEPRILILDEPTAGLDWRSQQELLAVVRTFHDHGHTVVLITHDMRLVADYTQRAIVLLGGRVLFDGTTRTLFQQGAILSAAGLALPPVARLARRWHSLGIRPGILTGRELVSAWTGRALRRQAVKRVCR
jgi:energy-coupling factor transport system ATP-binding protein